MKTGSNIQQHSRTVRHYVHIPHHTDAGDAEHPTTIMLHQQTSPAWGPPSLSCSNSICLWEGEGREEVGGGNALHNRVIYNMKYTIYKPEILNMKVHNNGDGPVMSLLNIVRDIIILAC